MKGGVVGGGGGGVYLRRQEGNGEIVMLWLELQNELEWALGRAHTFAYHKIGH